MRRTLAVAAYAVALLLWCAVIGIPNDAIGIALWLWLLAICWRGSPSWDFPRDWWPWLLALAVYGLARGLTDDLGFAPHVRWPVTVDEWLGGGTVPTVTLQQHWCGVPCRSDGEVRWYDVALNAVYASHFTVGPVLAGILWLRGSALWVSWIRRYVAIAYVALVGYIVFPMAPPWYAARAGLIEPVARITSRGFRELGIERQTMIFSGLPNKTAAMPSLHAGIAFLVAYFAIAHLRSRWRFLMLLYPLAMSLALVYFGEHYVVDTVFGALAAGVAMAGCRWWERRPPRQREGRSSVTSAATAP